MFDICLLWNVENKLYIIYLLTYILSCLVVVLDVIPCLLFDPRACNTDTHARTHARTQAHRDRERGEGERERGREGERERGREGERERGSKCERRVRPPLNGFFENVKLCNDRFVPCRIGIYGPLSTKWHLILAQ